MGSENLETVLKRARACTSCADHLPLGPRPVVRMAPRPECAPQWHGALRALLPEVRLTLLIGTYAQKYHLGSRAPATMTETVARWRDFLPDYLPTPHPSWRTTHWMKKNPWFESDLLPDLRRVVAKALA